MGFIKEPVGVDFVIKSEPFTDKDRADISQFIADYKAKNASVGDKKIKVKVKQRV